MLNRNYADTIANIANKSASLITPPKNENYIAIMRQAGEDYQKGKQLQADNAFTEEMVKLHPEDEAKIRQMGGRAYADVMQGREWQLADADTQFARQKELAQMNFGNQLALENVRNQHAIGLKKLSNALKNQTDDAALEKSRANAQLGLDLLGEVARDDKIKSTKLGQLWNKYGNATDVDTERGKITSAIAAIAPAVIAEAKKSGASQINTLGEVMTYLGLPDVDKTNSATVRGALQGIADRLGLRNPLVNEKNVQAAEADPLGLR